MPDLTHQTTVLTSKLENCRDTLRERADELSEWIDDFVKAQVVNITLEFGQVVSNQLKDLIFELQGDLDDWARELTNLIGDDA